MIAAAPAGLRHVAPGVVGAVVAATLVDMAIVRLVRGVWFFPSGALLSGLIVALILSPAEPWYVPAITAALAVGSKYVLRTKQGHIFNPAALALVAAYFLFATGQDWWGALPDLPLPFLLVLLATGLFVADRVNKLPMVLIFTGCYFLFSRGMHTRAIRRASPRFSARRMSMRRSSSPSSCSPIRRPPRRATAIKSSSA